MVLNGENMTKMNVCLAIKKYVNNTSVCVTARIT